MYAPHNRVSKYIRQKKKKKIELKGEIYKSTIIIGDFKTSLSVIYQ